MFNTGVVEGEVEAFERLDRLVQSGPDILFPRHIAFDRQCAPVGPCDQTRRFLVAAFRKVGRDDTGARARESQRRCAAYAVGRTGYKRSLPCNLVERFVARLKGRVPDRFDALEFSPGEQAQVDYGLEALRQANPEEVPSSTRSSWR